MNEIKEEKFIPKGALAFLILLLVLCSIIHRRGGFI
jgi:hypothetical protein